MKYFKKLESKRLYLSQMHIEDAEIFCEWMNDKNVTDGLGSTKKLTTIEKEKEYLEKANTSDDYNFSIIKKEDNSLIGSCTLGIHNQINQHGEIGILIGDEKNRNKGYGKEVIIMLLDYGFNTLNLHSIEIGAFSFNERAIICYKHIGFKEVGRIRENNYHEGKMHDSIILDMLKDEFNELYK